MAIFKKVAYSGKYQDDNAIPELVSYIMKPEKTPNEILGGYKVDMNNIAGSMIQVSEFFQKNSLVRVHHFIVSFLPYEIPSMGIVICIANTICSYIGPEYQIIYAFHEDKQNPHLHFAFNAVSYTDGHRYRSSRSDYHNLYSTIKQVLHSYRIFNLIPVSYHPNDYEPHE